MDKPIPANPQAPPEDEVLNSDEWWDAEDLRAADQDNQRVLRWRRSEAYVNVLEVSEPLNPYEDAVVWSAWFPLNDLAADGGFIAGNRVFVYPEDVDAPGRVEATILEVPKPGDDWDVYLVLVHEPGREFEPPDDRIWAVQEGQLASYS